MNYFLINNYLIMTWIYLKPEDLDTYLNEFQLSRLQLTSGTVDRSKTLLATLIEDITARIRLELSGKESGCSLDSNPMHIPRELKSAASYLILEALQTRVPGLALTADQLRQCNEARMVLSRISRGELQVEGPENGTQPLRAPSRIERVRSRAPMASSVGYP